MVKTVCSTVVDRLFFHVGKEVKRMMDNEFDSLNDKSGLQSRSEPDTEETAKPKKRKKTSQAFRDNIITDTETAKAKGKKGGERSGEVRRENAQKRKDAREAVRYLLDLTAKGNLKKNLKTQNQIMQ